MTLADAGPAFAAPLAALHALCFPDDPWDAGLLARLLAMPGVIGLFAGDAGDAATQGLVLVRVAADEAEILTIGVTPAARGRGLGTTLVAAAAARAAAAGAASLFLEVAEDNLAGRALYAHHGFAAVGRRPGYYARPGGTAVAALVLGLALSVTTSQ